MFVALKRWENMQVIDLRSDTVTKPTLAMRSFMMDAEVGDDVFAEDPTVNKLQDMIAQMLNKEAALYVGSGTQGNQTCINAHTMPGDEVICDINSHIFNFESGAPALLSGVQIHPLIGHRGHLTVEQVKEAFRPTDDHYPQSRLIVLENTHNKAGGTIYPLDQIEAISKFARESGLKMHLDGARLWNASIATGIPLAKYASYFDSVTLCFSKGLGAPIGSIIAGDKNFIKRVHYYRKVYGGGMRQVGILAAACIFAVENHFERLHEDHENTKLLAEAFQALPGFKIEPESVETNILMVDISDTGKPVTEILDILRNEGVLALALSNRKLRFVTHLDVSREAIYSAIDIFQKLFA
jgi:threonine aldolase